MLKTVEITFEGEPAAAESWTVQRGRLRETVDRPFELTLRIATDVDAPDPPQLLGKPAKLTLVRGDGMRVVAGIVAELTERSAPDAEHTAVLDVTIRPALESLRHRVDTRIFQDKSVPEILEEVLNAGLGPHGRSVENRLQRAYPTTEYRVQYAESDLAFCRRLMEEEGIAHWFEVDDDTETLVLADVPSAWVDLETAAGEGRIALAARGDADLEEETISELSVTSAVTSTKVVMRHFDWTHPARPIEAESSDEAGDPPGGAHVDPPREVYVHDEHTVTLSDYAGTAYGADDAADRVVARREARASEARVAEGRSTVTSMRPGGVFELGGHPLVGRDGRYRVLSVEHDFDGENAHYQNRFRCLPEEVPHRPAARTPRPKIRSVQTAMVVGPAGEEIHTDEHGRIKVQFHWDRHGAMDDKSSCFIRVMQPWAGAGWGFVFLPRIGMEVVVRFVDGDPDRPLVIGSVYDGERRVPYPLPGDKTKSTIKTESTIGGGGYNELRFDDAAGSEQVFIHAQKDFDEVVENDHATTVHHDQSIRVDNDQSQEIGNDQTEHVFANQDLTVDADRTIAVHGDYAETIDGSETRTVSSGVTETIDAGETRTVTGGMTETIVGDRTQDITGDSTESITGSLSQTIAGTVALSTLSTYDVTAAGGITIIAPAGVTIIAPAGHQIVAPGGQSIVDSKWDKSGNEWFDCRASKVSATTFKFSWRALALTGYGLGFEYATIKVGKYAMKLPYYGGYFQSEKVVLRKLGLTMNVSGSHVTVSGGA